MKKNMEKCLYKQKKKNSITIICDLLKNQNVLLLNINEV